LKDREELLMFYDFPAEHPRGWCHIRTMNPIESMFATVCLRHKKTKGNGSRRACLAMVFKLCQSAQKRWRRLNKHELIQDVSKKTGQSKKTARQENGTGTLFGKK